MAILLIIVLAYFLAGVVFFAKEKDLHWVFGVDRRLGETCKKCRQYNQCLRESKASSFLYWIVALFYFIADVIAWFPLAYGKYHEGKLTNG